MATTSSERSPSGRPSMYPKPPTKTEGQGGDFTASIVVFLVALPLCIGIAEASDVPAELGIITGIIGGILVGALAGSPLQVSGPAAGLMVLVSDMVVEYRADYGLAALGLAVLLSGIIQTAAGLLKLGRWFRAVSPAVIGGMLAGIGVLIFTDQFHRMLDDKPPGKGIPNLITIPEAMLKGIVPLDGSVHHLAAAIGIVTILGIVGWNRFRPKPLSPDPGRAVRGGRCNGGNRPARLGHPQSQPGKQLPGSHNVPQQQRAEPAHSKSFLGSSCRLRPDR